MKTNVFKTVLIGLVTVTSLTASAGYHKCYGKNMTVTLGRSADGLYLRATKNGSEAGMAFKGQVEVENIIFNNSGESLKDVSVAFATDYFGATQAGLNLNIGNFYSEDIQTGKILLNEENMTCSYSDGE